MKNYNFVEILQNLRRINNLLETKMSPKEYNKDIQKYSDRCLMGFEFEVCFPNEEIQKYYNHLDVYELNKRHKDDFIYSIIEKKLKIKLQDVKQDDSVDSLKEDENLNHPCEIVTKPVPVLEAFKQLEKITNYLKSIDAETNHTTGLHVGVSFKDSPKLDFLKLVMFSGEEHVLKQFSREFNAHTFSHNSYLQKLFYKEDSNDIQSIINFFNKNLDFEKHRFSNLTKYQLNPPYIEFRAMGGDYLNQLEKVKETAGRFVRIFGIASDPEAFKEEYYKKVWQLFEKINNNNKEININEVLKLHEEWITSNGSSGRRLDISEYPKNLLSFLKLEGINLNYANLESANLSSTDLTGVNLIGTDLIRTNLSNVNLNHANLRGADLFYSNLTGADLRGADLTNVNLYGANLTNCVIDEYTIGISEDLIQKFNIEVM